VKATVLLARADAVRERGHNVKKLLSMAAIAALLLSAQVMASAEAGRVIILVRHAERASTAADSPISDVGRARAQCLARTLAESGVQRILTSDVARTQQTAEPLAMRLKIEPTALPAADIDALIRNLRASPARVQLVVGHSNTLPQIIAALGGSNIAPIADNEFDRMVVLTMWGPQDVVVTSLRYCPAVAAAAAAPMTH
jgi:phosphohistidine phosphatase SixA